MLTLRTASLSVFSLKLQSLDIDSVKKELSSLGEDLPLSDPAPIILDFASLPENQREDTISVEILREFHSVFQQHGLKLLGLRNAPKIWHQALLEAHLLDLGGRRDHESSSVIKSVDTTPSAENIQPTATETSPKQHNPPPITNSDIANIPVLDASRILEAAPSNPTNPTAIEQQPSPPPVKSPFFTLPSFLTQTPPKPTVLPTVIVDKPLRSGQKVYAKGANAVVLAMVSVGAEVIADGDIHVYAPLRGRALAGAAGDNKARIFTTSFDAELVSIAGVWKNFAEGFDSNLKGKGAQIYLERMNGQEKLRIDTLATQ